MASSQISIGTDPVKQFSVFAENRVGRLYDLTRCSRTTTST